MKRILWKREGFSLIEMLVVMVIMGVALSIAMPAFGPRTKIYKLKYSTENLAQALESAKQYASTNSTDCYVVFPIGTTDNTRNGMAYKIYWQDDSNNWHTVGKWEYFFKGVTVNIANSTLNTMLFPFPDNTNSATLLSYVRFVPGGRAHTAATIRLTEAHTQDFCELRAQNYPTSIKIGSIGEEV